MGLWPDRIVRALADRIGSSIQAEQLADIVPRQQRAELEQVARMDNTWRDSRAVLRIRIVWTSRVNKKQCDQGWWRKTGIK